MGILPVKDLPLSAGATGSAGTMDAAGIIAGTDELGAAAVAGATDEPGALGIAAGMVDGTGTLEEAAAGSAVPELPPD